MKKTHAILKRYKNVTLNIKRRVNISKQYIIDTIIRILHLSMKYTLDCKKVLLF